MKATRKEKLVPPEQRFAPQTLTKAEIANPESIVPLCPFTGEPLQLVEFGDTKVWRAAGTFFYTGFFPTKRQLIHKLLQRPGYTVPFDAVPRIEVTERTEPHVDHAEVASDAKAERAEQAVHEFIDRNADKLGLVK